MFTLKMVLLNINKTVLVKYYFNAMYFLYITVSVFSCLERKILVTSLSAVQFVDTVCKALLLWNSSLVREGASSWALR